MLWEISAGNSLWNDRQLFSVNMGIFTDDIKLDLIAAICVPKNMQKMQHDILVEYHVRDYFELIELQNDLMAYIVPQSMSCGILHRFLLMNTYDYLSKPHTIPIIDKAWVVYGMIDGRSKSDEPGGLLVDLLQTRYHGMPVPIIWPDYAHRFSDGPVRLVSIESNLISWKVHVSHLVRFDLTEYDLDMLRLLKMTLIPLSLVGWRADTWKIETQWKDDTIINDTCNFDILPKRTVQVKNLIQRPDKVLKLSTLALNKLYYCNKLYTPFHYIVHKDIFLQKPQKSLHSSIYWSMSTRPIRQNIVEVIFNSHGFRASDTGHTVYIPEWEKDIDLDTMRHAINRRVQ